MLAWLAPLLIAAMIPTKGLRGDRATEAVPPTTNAANPDEVYSGWPFDAREAAKRQNDTAKTLGIQKLLTLSLGNGVGMKLVLIPAGTFIMGTPKSEQTKARMNDEVQHEVTISKPFYMGITHVTVAQYAQFVKDTGQTHNEPAFKQTGDHPVVNVSWDDAKAFCTWLSQKTGKTVGLPTEGQWEYACRAGTTSRYSFGDKDSDLGVYAWHGGNSGGVTHPAGRKKPNAWGLYDMHGIAWQWCSDYYGPYAAADKKDPAGPKTGKQHVVRGGSWASDYPANCRSAFRSADDMISRRAFVGFRVVIALSLESVAKPPTQPAAPQAYDVRRKPPPGTPINWKHPLAEGLVSAVPLNEGAGNTFYDAAAKESYSARALAGTPKNGLPPAWITPPVSADYPWIGPAISNNNATAQSICGRLKEGQQFIENVKNGYSYAVLVQPLDDKTFGRIMDGTGAAVITIYLNIPGREGLVDTTWRGAGRVPINPTAKFKTNEWILVLCTVQQGLGVMYINGKEVARNTHVDLTQSWAKQTGQLVYNATGNGAMMTNANFSSWWVWNDRILNARDAAELYANPWAMFESGK